MEASQSGADSWGWLLCRGEEVQPDRYQQSPPGHRTPSPLSLLWDFLGTHMPRPTAGCLTAQGVRVSGEATPTLLLSPLFFLELLLSNHSSYHQSSWTPVSSIRAV